MAISFHNGDILDGNCNIICHQVNFQGIMGERYAKYPRKSKGVCVWKITRKNLMR